MATCFLEKNYDRDYLVSKIVQDPSSAKMTTKPVTEGFAVACTMEVFFCRHCHNDPDSKSCSGVLRSTRQILVPPRYKPKVCFERCTLLTVRISMNHGWVSDSGFRYPPSFTVNYSFLFFMQRVPPPFQKVLIYFLNTRPHLIVTITESRIWHGVAFSLNLYPSSCIHFAKY